MSDGRHYSKSSPKVVNNPGRPAWVPPQIHEAPYLTRVFRMVRAGVGPVPVAFWPFALSCRGL